MQLQCVVTQGGRQEDRWGEEREASFLSSLGLNQYRKWIWMAWGERGRKFRGWWGPWWRDLDTVCYLMPVSQTHSASEERTRVHKETAQKRKIWGLRSDRCTRIFIYAIDLINIMSLIQFKTQTYPHVRLNAPSPKQTGAIDAHAQTCCEVRNICQEPLRWQCFSAGVSSRCGGGHVCADRRIRLCDWSAQAK